MNNKTRWMAGVTAAMLGAVPFVQADDASYRVLKPVSVTGNAVTPPVTYRALPLDRSWAQFSTSDVELVRNQYADLRAHEEPPFPAGGLATLARELSALQRQQNLRGELHAVIRVDAAGRATAVSWQMAPAQGPVTGLETILKQTTFEPATCAHTACAMDFPLHVEFGDTLLAFN